MSNFLKVSVSDYKGGELETSVKTTLSETISWGTKSKIEQDLEENYASGDEGIQPTKFFTIKDGNIVEMSKDEIFNQLEKENHQFDED